jgi:hypothetical protein
MLSLGLRTYASIPPAVAPANRECSGFSRVVIVDDLSGQATIIDCSEDCELSERGEREAQRLESWARVTLACSGHVERR